MDRGVSLLSGSRSSRPRRRPIPTTTRPRLTLLLAASLLGWLSAAGVADAAPSGSDRIVGGTLATRAWPAQGFLRLTTSAGNYSCGGSLVTGRWFVTAAHCATDENGTVLLPSAFKITLGRSDLSVDPTGERHSVDKVIRHADYDDATTDNDIALLHISTATAPPQQPLGVVTASETALWAPGTIATIIGWGTTCESGCSGSTQLREATVPIDPDATCSSLTSYGARLSSGDDGLRRKRRDRYLSGRLRRAAHGAAARRLRARRDHVLGPGLCARADTRGSTRASARPR